MEMKMKLKMTNRSHRHDITSARSSNRHKYILNIKWLSTMMTMYTKTTPIKQHLKLNI